MKTTAPALPIVGATYTVPSDDNQFIVESITKPTKTAPVLITLRYTASKTKLNKIISMTVKDFAFNVNSRIFVLSNNKPVCTH